MPKACPTCKEEMEYRSANVLTVNKRIVKVHYWYCPVCGHTEDA